MRYSDKNVLEAISNGNDRQALAALYDKLFPVVSNLIKKLGGDEDEAKDLFQDAIMAFYNKVVQGEFDSDYKISTFITHVAQMKWYTRFQKKSRMDYLSPTFDQTHSEIGTYKFVFDEERRSVIQEVFDSLGEQCSKILELVIYQRLNMKEIAEMLGYANENSVKTKHYKCKQQMIKKMSGNAAFKELLMS